MNKMIDTPTLAEKCMEAGFTLEEVMYDGVVIPKIMIDKVKTMRQRKLRYDDILLASFPKSGTHWVWEILNMIVAGKAEYAKHWLNSSWLEYRTEKDLEELDSPRILHTHLLPRFLPDRLWHEKRKIVYIQRNPKDVAASYYNQFAKQVWKDASRHKLLFTGTWDDFFEIFMEGVQYGNWFDHVIEWNKVADVYPNTDVCYIKYEDMKEDCAREIKKMAEYLGRPLPNKIYHDVAEACNFQRLKHISENEKDQTFHVKWTGNTEGYFRKGIVGDWKNWFTVGQCERLDRIYEEKLKEKFPY